MEAWSGRLSELLLAWVSARLTVSLGETPGHRLDPDRLDRTALYRRNELACAARYVQFEAAITAFDGTDRKAHV